MLFVEFLHHFLCLWTYESGIGMVQQMVDEIEQIAVTFGLVTHGVEGEILPDQ